VGWRGKLKRNISDGVGWRDILPLEGVRGVIKRSGVYVHGCLPPMSKIDAKGTLGGPVTEGNELP
jgi:hypothetical protein